MSATAKGPAWFLCCLLAAAVPARSDSHKQEFSDFTTPLPVERGARLVIGVVGGWERWDNPVRCIRRTAIAVKRHGLGGVHVETVENHSLELAEQLVRRAFDFNRDGTLSPDEAAQGRVILFGQSLGGRAALRLSRTLQAWGVPVALLIVVDAYGRDTYQVPPNVRKAANFYQRDHLFIKGAEEIRAADPSSTTILFNRRISFKNLGRVTAGEHSLLERIWLDEHARMEYVPEVWNEVERQIIEAASARD